MLPSGSEQCIFEVRSTWGSLELSAVFSCVRLNKFFNLSGSLVCPPSHKDGMMTEPSTVWWTVISGNFSTSTQVQNVARIKCIIMLAMMTTIFVPTVQMLWA